MAPGSIEIRHEELSIEQGEHHQSAPVSKSSDDLLGRLSHEVFKYDCLDRRLKRHHVTGIAFSGAVGVGLFQTSGQIIALSGPVGALLAYLFAGLTIFAVMRSLAEMASIRPVSGAIMDYPDVFVDEALGFAAITPPASSKAVLRLPYLALEVKSWLFGGCMSYNLSSPSADSARTCLTIAMFQFMGGEIVLVTAAEAESPRRDLPTAARYMYLLPVSLYLVVIFFVGLCVNYLDPRLPHPHVEYYSPGSRLDGITTGTRSPFVIVIQNAGISGLPGFLNAAFLFSALTAANSALYVSSRTVFFLARKSSFKFIKETVGRTNNGHTPLAAIVISFVPGVLAFLAIGAAKTDVQEV
ncbi:hypothetical protein HO133_001805 [Letharia lupina]|uniref:Amino acid permease/ SLC12A domain-containing protein n=1 Tax=Letharia lupina TaxID=560253 RepID=A0A8H6CE73_9LECA|nr:uncharacterized protein HO133_001805 [Letharia lupina]KAF6221837.1 hypothetical protein HO133_001805 [Letharia lupina]